MDAALLDTPTSEALSDELNSDPRLVAAAAVLLQWLFSQTHDSGSPAKEHEQTEVTHVVTR